MAGPTTESLDRELAALRESVHKIDVVLAEMRAEMRTEFKALHKQDDRAHSWRLWGVGAAVGIIVTVISWGVRNETRVGQLATEIDHLRGDMAEQRKLVDASLKRVVVEVKEAVHKEAIQPGIVNPDPDAVRTPVDPPVIIPPKL